MKKLLLSRRLVQLGAIGLLFLPLLMEKPLWLGTYISSELFSLSLTDPLSALEVSLAGKVFYSPLFWSALPLVLAAMALGRVFCGWICPLNTVMEILALLIPPRQKEAANTYTPYLVLAAVSAASALVSLPLFTMVSPIGAISRAVTFGLGIEVLLLGAVLAIQWIWGRKAWCRILCPAGALYGLFGRWRLLRVRLDNNTCTNCGECRRTCAMRAEPGSAKPLHIMSCVSCADCISCCEQKALEFSFTFNRKGGDLNHESFESPTR